MMLTYTEKVKYIKQYRSTYNTWKSMVDRCRSNTEPMVSLYKNRGIKVCNRWLGDAGFINFLEDMGERPANLTIDRIDNYKNYEPSNCRWATTKQQSRNRRNNRNIEYNGKTQTIMDWAIELGVTWNCLKSRLDIYDWSIEKTLTTPKSKNHHPPRIIVFNNKSQNLEEWAREIGLSAKTITNRLDNLGWSIEKTLTTSRLR